MRKTCSLVGPLALLIVGCSAGATNVSPGAAPPAGKGDQPGNQPEDGTSTHFRIDGQGYLTMELAGDPDQVIVTLSGPRVGGLHASVEGVQSVVASFPASACQQRPDTSTVLDCTPQTVQLNLLDRQQQPLPVQGALHWVTVSTLQAHWMGVDPAGDHDEWTFDFTVSADFVAGTIGELQDHGRLTQLP
jgi:hypothetical protein